MKIGFIGAGFMSRGLAEHALANGHEVMLSNSRGLKSLRSAKAVLKCEIGTTADAAAFGEVIFVAVPLDAIEDLPRDLVAGKILVDLCNHYPERDGPMPDIETGVQTTSGYLAVHFEGAQVVKAFNAIMAKDLAADGRPQGDPERRGLPFAGDDEAAKAIVAGMIDAFGFDPVDVGPLAEGWRFERARPVYCVPMDAKAMQEQLAVTSREDMVGESSWHRKDG